MHGKYLQMKVRLSSVSHIIARAGFSSAAAIGMRLMPHTTSVTAVSALRTALIPALVSGLDEGGTVYVVTVTQPSGGAVDANPKRRGGNRHNSDQHFRRWIHV
jgi:hypothetical protein